MYSQENLVSIITPSYNSEEFISETIISIINQTYSNWELLITDDCSKDNTINIVKSFQENDIRIKLFILKSNGGSGLARNNSIRNAKGRYIAFCDSDDQWKIDKIEKQLGFMDRLNLSFTYSSYDVVDEFGSFKSVIEAPKTISYKKMLNNNYVGCLTAIYDRKLLGNLFMNEIRKRQDWALWLYIMKIIKTTSGMSESLAIYRDRSNSISTNKVEMLKYNYQIYNMVLGYNHLFSFFLISNYIFQYLIKKIKKQ
jgi:teichuronic acid biosynthesis glycosyltransferase TuaG